MTTYVLKENAISKYLNFVLVPSKSIEESKLKLAILGIVDYAVEDAKTIANVGEFLLFGYKDKLVPFIVLDKHIYGNQIDVVLQSYYVLKKYNFDDNTNRWKDSELRDYLNNAFLDGCLDIEFVKILKTEVVHTDNYVTHDKIWVPSHEEVGYDDIDGMFKKNIKTKTYAYYNVQHDIQYRPFKFTDTLTDAWYLRSVFVGNVDSVAAYKFWMRDRKVRGQDIRYATDIKFCCKI